jgi:hypothetical protein
MRSFLTSLLALIVSLLVGELIVQLLAVESGGTEEWIVAFGMAILVAGAVAFVFLIVQLAAGSGRASNIVALVLAIVFAILAGLVVWANFALATGAQKDDAVLLAGIVLPGFAIILVQWLIVRWLGPRAAPAPVLPRFGRGGHVS